MPNNPRTTVAIWAASSRVGESTSMRQLPGGRGLTVGGKAHDRLGSAKAAVLPVPVCAMPQRSRPSMKRRDRLRPGWAWGCHSPSRSTRRGFAAKGRGRKTLVMKIRLFRSSVGAGRVSCGPRRARLMTTRVKWVAVWLERHGGLACPGSPENHAGRPCADDDRHAALQHDMAEVLANCKDGARVHHLRLARDEARQRAKLEERGK